MAANLKVFASILRILNVSSVVESLGESLADFIAKMARDRAFRFNSFGISTTIAFAFCYVELTLKNKRSIRYLTNEKNIRLK
ncbi:hypothetical protein FH581_014985 [Leptospira weilii]|uniref:hypothetical protein n=1 Tax=Leptospira weilii TaxID=28184 RepID=UPI0002BE867C|nr:hypothetical protein [Leptospira weilii]EMN42497.1 hypothetical protein LEP1GSC086_1353 [Leptospira weilii str. LNT 1234]ULH27745.1 hypothetical protein FH586_15280 [Leptospira weilii]UPY77232.1 hypothetical protein FH581_014985 [Leptospira weilii]